HGRGIFALDDIIPIEQTTEQVASAPVTVFPIRTTYDLQGGRMMSGGGGGFFFGGGGGTEIYYNLGEAHNGKNAVKVAIKDSKGNLITTLNGTGHKGLNVVAWRGNYDGPVTAILPPEQGEGGGFGFRPRGTPGQATPDAGPHAVAGEYTATVTVDGLAPQSQTVRLSEDPRWPHPADAAAKNAEALRAALAARDQVSAMNRMLTGLQSLKDQLKAQQTSLKSLDEAGGPSAGYADVAKAAGDLEKKVGDLEYKIYNPDQGKGEATVYLTDFQQQFEGAYNSLQGSADAAPRPNYMELWQSLQGQLEGYLNQYNQLLKTDAVAFNKLAAAHHAITLAVGDTIALPAAGSARSIAPNRQR
ncbi:MAG TPA: hypothetical protein VFP94_07880, partial [Terriglobales bacterium]|nr:hypothetical protein [Terriglobales bacterium]